MFSRTTCMITNVKKSLDKNILLQPTDSLWQCSFFSFLMKRLLMNLFQGQFVPLHYASPTVHRFTRKIHAHVCEQKISCLFFFEVSKKNCHRHVNGFGDISLYL